MELFMCSVKQREGYGEVFYILNKLHDFYFNLILLKKGVSLAISIFIVKSQ
jgi:hypothetical protein